MADYTTVRFELVINDAPKSLNAGGAGSRAHWAVANAEKKRWQGLILAQLLLCKVPKSMVRCRTDAEIVWRRNARRDSTNYLAPVVKPLADVLAPPRHLYHKIAGQRIAVPNHAPRWLEDDTDEFFQFNGLRFRVAPDELPPLVKAQLRIHLEADYAY